jgi:hypothetical protein
MAKTKPKTVRKPSEEVLGQTREELLRDLGLDQLTREACLRGVFTDLLDEPGSGVDGWIVTQVGPGRRSSPS